MCGGTWPPFHGETKTRPDSQFPLDGTDNLIDAIRLLSPSKGAEDFSPWRKPWENVLTKMPVSPRGAKDVNPRLAARRPPAHSASGFWDDSKMAESLWPQSIWPIGSWYFSAIASLLPSQLVFGMTILCLGGGQWRIYVEGL